jgi:hypothetical protein
MAVFGVVPSIAQLISIPCPVWFAMLTTFLDLGQIGVIMRCWKLLWSNRVQDDNIMADLNAKELLHASMSGIDSQRQSGTDSTHHPVKPWKPNFFTRNK